MRLCVVWLVAACGRVGFDQSATGAAASYHDTVIAAGPAGYWPLATDASDASGHGNNGSTTGTIAFDPVAGCARFGDHTWITIGDVFGFSAGETFTLELWLDPDIIDTFRPVLVKGDYIALDSGYALAIAGDGAELHWFATGANNGATSVPIASGAWTHWVTVVVGTEVAFFLDGVLAEHRGIQRWPASPQPLTISGPSDGVHGGAFFHGCLADVAVYTRALGPDEIATHHVAGQRR